MPGLPKSYIKKYGVSKKAWREYRMKHPKKSSKGKSKPRSKPKTTRRSTKRRMNPVSKKRGFLSTATFMKFARLFALAAPAAAVAVGPGEPVDKIKQGAKIYTGFDMNTGTFNFGDLAQGWLPYLATTAVTVGISKLSGIIRRL